MHKCVKKTNKPKTLSLSVAVLTFPDPEAALLCVVLCCVHTAATVASLLVIAV